MIKPAILAATLLAAIQTGPATAAVAERPIQPGAAMTAPAGCTFNFVFTDPDGVLYIGTAGHCTSSEGDLVKDPTGITGRVVYRSFIGVGTDDFALVEIERARYLDVSPQMRRWGGPTGATETHETRRGDLLFHNGYGMAFGSTAVTRPRVGVLQEDTARAWFSNSPIIWGDSGGPVLHASGEALGVVSGISGGSMVGTTIERVYVLLGEAGFGDLTIATAPFEGIA